MNYFIGIDGGGTKTHLKAVDVDKRLVGEAFGGASNLSALPESRVAENLRHLLKEFFQRTGLVPAECGALCLGTAGAGSEIVRKKLKGILFSILSQCRITVTDDALPALYGGTLSGCGVILISGTGSICLARSRNHTVRTGGWGHILGDEGSGYAISTAMLRAVMAAFDGRGRETALTRLVLSHLHLSSPENLPNYIYYSGKGKAEIAALAFLCDEGYNNNDNIAQSIIRKAAEDLGVMAVAAERKARFEGGGNFCVYAGGTLCGSEPLREELKSFLFRSGSRLRLYPCRDDAAYGCALIALESAEAVITGKD